MSTLSTSDRNQYRSSPPQSELPAIATIAIVGAGPAGMTAAIQLKRTGLNPLLLEGRRSGGLLVNANVVENYPGFPNGISGPALVDRFRAQLDALEITPILIKVRSIACMKDTFQLSVVDELNDRKSLIEAHAVIVATGTEPKPLIISGMEACTRNRIVYEVYDLPKTNRPGTIAIIGGGDAAIDYGLNLASRKHEVKVLYRGGRLRCLPLLEQRARDEPLLTLCPRTTVTAIEENGQELVMRIATRNQEQVINGTLLSRYLLIAIGRRAAMPEIIRENRRDAPVEIRADGTTDVDGFYVCGDVRRGHYRQAGIAVGDGLLAAMMAAEYVTSRVRR